MEILIHLSKLLQIYVLKANLLPKEILFTLLDLNHVLQDFVLFPMKRKCPFFITNIKRKNTLLNIVDFLKDFLKVKKKRKLTSKICEEFLRNWRIKLEILLVH